MLRLPACPRLLPARLPQILAGAVVSSGELDAEVTAIGADTFFGKTMALLGAPEERGHLQTVGYVVNLGCQLQSVGGGGRPWGLGVGLAAASCHSAELDLPPMGAASLNRKCKGTFEVRCETTAAASCCPAGAGARQRGAGPAGRRGLPGYSGGHHREIRRRRLCLCGEAALQPRLAKSLHAVCYASL
jgi:hypothetical protein